MVQQRNDTLRITVSRHNLYGNLLLIDVDSVPDGQTYGIPDENPFKDDPELGLPEIFTFGWRMPWRCSIDGKSDIYYIDFRFYLLKS